MEPEVSLVMPAWNPPAAWFREAVESALAEERASVELIVVDDGSAVPVSDLLADVGDSRLNVVRVSHRGAARARDAGLAEARGAFVRFLDADDVVVAGSTGRLLRLAGDEGGAIAYGWTLLCESDGTPIREARSELEGRIAAECVAGGFDAYVVSMLFPRDVVRSAGSWAEADFRVSEDWDFVLRCLERAPVRCLPEVVTRYRRHAASLSRTADVAAGADAGAAVIRRYFERNPQLRGGGLERRAYARHHLNRAGAHASRGDAGPAARELARAGRRDPRAAALTAGRIAGGGLRRAVPAPLRDRARIAAARRLENRARSSTSAAGAAVVLHAVAERDGDRELEIDPPIAVERLDWMVEHLAGRYRLVRAGDLADAALHRRAGEPLPIAFTFDDDLPSHAAHALPVFERHGAVATAFLCRPEAPFWWWRLQRAIDERLIEADDLPHLEHATVAAALAREPRAIKRLAGAIEALGPAERDEVEAALAGAAGEGFEILMDADVERLADAGWELGAHTRRHYRLATLDDGLLGQELERRPVRARGEPPTTIAYPHGKAGEREAAAVAAAGYSTAFTGRPEAFSERTDMRLIGRLQPDLTSPGRFALDLARSLAR